MQNSAKQQRIRKLLLLVSFLLFPITIFYFSPYLIILGAFKGIITGSFIVFVMQFVFSLFFGRAFCGWLCPAGALQDMCANVVNTEARGGKYSLIKYFIWVPWLAAIVFGIISAGGIHKIDFLFQTEHGISISEPILYTIYYAIVLFFIIVPLTAGRRAACHYVCWMAPFMIIGTKFKEFLGIPSLRLKAEQEKCVHCKLCNKKCLMSLNVEKMVSDGKMYNAECVLCGECVDNCPKKAIRYSLK